MQYENKTPLIRAAESKSAQAPAVVERLLEGGADVNAVDKVSAWERGKVWGGICIYFG